VCHSSPSPAQEEGSAAEHNNQFGVNLGITQNLDQLRKQPGSSSSNSALFGESASEALRSSARRRASALAAVADVYAAQVSRVFCLYCRLCDAAAGVSGREGCDRKSRRGGWCWRDVTASSSSPCCCCLVVVVVLLMMIRIKNNNKLQNHDDDDDDDDDDAYYQKIAKSNK
jgi:hypothetical protein